MGLVTGRILVEKAEPIQARKELVNSGWNKRTVVDVSISRVHCRKRTFVLSKLDKYKFIKVVTVSS